MMLRVHCTGIEQKGEGEGDRSLIFWTVTTGVDGQRYTNNFILDLNFPRGTTLRPHKDFEKCWSSHLEGFVIPSRVSKTTQCRVLSVCCIGYIWWRCNVIQAKSRLCVRMCMCITWVTCSDPLNRLYHGKHATHTLLIICVLGSSNGPSYRLYTSKLTCVPKQHNPSNTASKQCHLSLVDILKCLLP